MGNDRPAIIFFHQGFTPYLAFSLAQALRSQPGSRVILLGDESNRIRGLPYEHHRLAPDSASVREFRKRYLHFHPGNLEDERRCIERWFHLADFVERERLTEFLFLDSDVLLFEDLAEFLPFWRTFDAAGSPLFYSFCFFSRPGLVGEFSRWILERYQCDATMADWRRRFDRHQRGETADAGVIHDMALSGLFVKEKNLRLLDVTQPAGGMLVDSGQWGGAYRQGRAGVHRLQQAQVGGPVLAWVDGDWMRMPAVHVQGFHKNHVSGFTGWSGPLRGAFFRRPWLKNLRTWPTHVWNGWHFRRYVGARAAT